MSNDQAPGQSETSAMNGNDETDGAPMQLPDELTVLKQRARMMGIAFSNNIGVDALKAKIREKLEEKTDEPVQTGDGEPAQQADVKRMTLRQHLIQENMKLVRLRIQNLDPKKKNLPGEIFTVANEYLGTVRKFIPYGEVTDGGYHVPHCLYELLREKTFVSIRVRKVNGREVVETRDAKEFALDVLPPLTPAELQRLAQAQIAAGSVSEAA